MSIYTTNLDLRVIHKFRPGRNLGLAGVYITGLHVCISPDVSLLPTTTTTVQTTQINTLEYECELVRCRGFLYLPALINLFLVVFFTGLLRNGS